MPLNVAELRGQNWCRFAVRENDGADYVISLGGRIDATLLDLIPGYCNVRVRFVDNSTMHSDTCSFQQALVELGEALRLRGRPCCSCAIILRDGPDLLCCQAERHTQPHCAIA